MRARDADEDDETTRGFDDDVRIETAAARDDEEEEEEEAREEDAEAHEDYSCKTPFERLARDVEAQMRRWMDGAATSTIAAASSFGDTLQVNGEKLSKRKAVRWADETVPIAAVTGERIRAFVRATPTTALGARLDDVFGD